MKIYRRNLWD